MLIYVIIGVSVAVVAHGTFILQVGLCAYYFYTAGWAVCIILLYCRLGYHSCSASRGLLYTCVNG